MSLRDKCTWVEVEYGGGEEKENRNSGGSGAEVVAGGGGGRVVMLSACRKRYMTKSGRDPHMFH